MPKLACEPVAVAAFARVVVLCAVAFGLGWTPEQIAAVMAVVEAGLALFVRSRVTPSEVAVAPLP